MMDSQETNEGHADANEGQADIPIVMNRRKFDSKEVIKSHNDKEGLVLSALVKSEKVTGGNSTILEKSPGATGGNSTFDKSPRATDGNSTFDKSPTTILEQPTNSSSISGHVQNAKRTDKSSCRPSSSPSLGAPLTLDMAARMLANRRNKVEASQPVTLPAANGNQQPGVQVSDESSSSDAETSRGQREVSGSPPSSRTVFSHQTSPVGPSRLSRIRQTNDSNLRKGVRYAGLRVNGDDDESANHLANRKAEQMKNRGLKLPELAENSELDTGSLLTSSATLNGSHSSPSPSSMPLISASEDSNDSPVASDNLVTPSLPDSLLKKLGLAVADSTDNDDNRVDQLGEKEIESRFVSLSLALRTDKLTLDQRVSVQERARDVAEKNVDTELLGLKDATETLNELVTEAQVRTLLHKIKQHVGILEQSVARVSSRAEVLGAVQQERRMCKAMEVMVVYTENLRRLREKEESELQEARKVLSERCANGFSMDSDIGLSRRSMSVCGFNAGGRPTRRRSEVALPRVLGGIGSPPLYPSSNLEQSPPFTKHSAIWSVGQDSLEMEDPKSRFQSAVASTSMQQAITSSMRRRSVEKQRSISMSASLSFAPSTLPTSSIPENSTSSTVSFNKETTDDSLSSCQGDMLDTGSAITQEEDAFRKGFREGLKTKLSQELSDLRDQQTSINQILEQVMEKVDQTEMEDDDLLSRPSHYERIVQVATKFGGHVADYDWRSNKTTIRNLTGFLFLLLAVIIVFLCPPISSIELGKFTKSSQ